MQVVKEEFVTNVEALQNIAYVGGAFALLAAVLLSTHRFPDFTPGLWVALVLLCIQVAAALSMSNTEPVSLNPQAGFNISMIGFVVSVAIGVLFMLIAGILRALLSNPELRVAINNIGRVNAAVYLGQSLPILLAFGIRRVI
jgi:hypothetical protein